MEPKWRLNLDETNSKKFQDFFEVYEYEKHLFTFEFREKYFIGDKHNRKCRFCGNSKPRVTFKKDAHIIPQFLGNRYILSTFECDECNALFSSYEDSFANFISPYRPFSFIDNSRNKKYPKHKETKFIDNKERTKLSIQQSDIRKVEILFEHPFDESISIDKENKEITINATKKPYVPIYVYKMLLKMAVSLVDESEVNLFKNTIGFLKDNTQNEKVKDYGLLRVYMHSLFGPPIFTFPTVYLYKKKEKHKDGLFPSKVFILYTSNHIYQIFIPFNKADNNLIDKTVTVYPYPILLDNQFYENGLKYSSFSELLTSNQKMYDQKHKMTFTFESGEFHVGGN